MENTNGSSSSHDVFTETVAPAGLHIHFPSSVDAPPARPSRNYPEYLQKSYGSSFSPPVRRSSPLNPQRSTHRRPSGTTLDSPTLRHRRIPSPVTMDAETLSAESEVDASLFSSEYDLSQEDPRILQDVQRAIKLKARREARLRRQQQSPILVDSSPNSVRSAASSPRSTTQSPWRPGPSSLPSPPLSPTPPRKASNSTAASDPIDFSPSTRPISASVYAHPAPSSLDNGATLDWSGADGEEDKHKWHHIHIGKRKEKDRILPLGVIAEQQEQMYKEKLHKIQTIASPQTQRKANITKQQLSRRYKLIQDTQKEPGATENWNYANVARWYSTVDPLAKRHIEKAEPFSWLRHLEAGRTTSRSQWHLTALIMEEYIQAHQPRRELHPPPPSNNLSAETIPDGLAITINPPDDQLSPTQETLSFRPHHRPALGLPEGRGKGAPESSSSFRFPNPTSPFPRPYLQSTGPRSDASSGVDSLSDFSDTGALKPVGSSTSKERSPSRNSADKNPMVLGPRNDMTAVALDLQASTSSKGSDPSGSTDSKSPQVPQPAFRKSPLPRRIWTSMPSSDTVRPYTEDSELRLRREYEIKLKTLEESNKQNHRIRQMLNRISASVREYESAQISSAKKPGVPYHHLPKELLDAFSHDPAAVTGSTRRLRGWRAVEDIHQRVIRQREIFHAFLSDPPPYPDISESILSGPAQGLLSTLEILEEHNDHIGSLTTEISRTLQDVQKMHADTKKEYNRTVSKTSVLYPELSHIVALEESYRDRYQRFYDFGMDALTVFLDTVTPLWRSYGKTVGEDIRDFLIIPLYRNEFTGEPKRYPITGFPRRSPRHWLSLIIFFFGSIIVTVLQVRTALTSIAHYRLHWIPYEGVRWTALPLFWVAIMIQCLAVLLEMVIVAFQLGTIAWWIGWLIKIVH